MTKSLQTLKVEIEKNVQVLQRLENYIVEFEHSRMDKVESNTDHAMILAQALTNYYTCLETIFLRVSKYFENCLPSDRWHQALLEKMTLEIDDVRARVVRDDLYLGLLEIMKFRHFARYYFELDYDWDKLMYLLKKFNDLREMVREDIGTFSVWLGQLAQ